MDLGADIVVHSATKFLCGHSDVTAGALITNDRVLHQQFAFQQNAEGAGLSPFESWLLLRGLKTLALRVERQNESAGKIARFLQTRAEVTQVFYPGLTDHAVHEKQATAALSLVSQPVTRNYQLRSSKQRVYSRSQSASAQ